MDFMSNAGLYIAVIGASLAVALACAGSGRGVGIVGEAAAGVISEDPNKFSSCLILQILPGHHGRVLRHPLPAGFLPDAAVYQVSSGPISQRKDGAKL